MSWTRGDFPTRGIVIRGFAVRIDLKQREYSNSKDGGFQDMFILDMSRIRGSWDSLELRMRES